MNCLMLLSRLVRREGWVTLDANPAHHPDIVAIIPPLPPEVTGQQWDEIEMVHGITSFYPWDANQLLREIRGVLAPGGKLVLEQPDFEVVKQSGHVSWIFGDPLLKDPLHMNKWAYVPASLVSALIEAGFGYCEILPAQHHVSSRDFRVEAHR